MDEEISEFPESGRRFLALRDDWIDHVNQCHALSHATARVGTFIALRMNAHNQRSNWPVKKIARMLGCSTKTVSVALEELRAENLLVVHRPSRRQKQTYFIHLPWTSDVVATSLSDVVSTSL